MKRLVIYAMAVIFVLGIGTAAIGQDKKGEPKVYKEKLTKVTATVEAIDLANRVVTLKGPKGNVFDLKVGEQAKNLPQVKVGDQVVAQYYESIVVQLAKPGAPGGTTASQAAESAKAGQMPGGAVASRVTVTATIVDISPKKTYVTLKGPEGKTMDVKVKDPKNLEGVKAGDQIEITYIEALAVSVEKAKTAEKAKKK
jgi:Cu/Ag efflux protein CusF